MTRPLVWLIAILTPAPLAGQACLGTTFSDDRTMVRAGAGAIEDVAVAGLEVLRDPVSPLGVYGVVEMARPADGSAVHVGARAVYAPGSPLGLSMCLAVGPGAYWSSGGGDYFGRDVSFRIFVAAVGGGIGYSLVAGPLVVNPYAYAEGHLLYKQMRSGSNSAYGGFSNAGRAVTELGLSVQWNALVLGAAAVTYPGSASLLEARLGNVEAGGSHAGFRIRLGILF